jgi:hypothetical protein
MSPIGGVAQKLQDSTVGGAPSPDGSRIAFLKHQEIWMMGPNGEAPARVFGATPGESLSQVAWSPDGRWLTYVRRTDTSGTAVLEARLPRTAEARVLFDSPDLQGFCWLYPGRLVLNLWEAPDQPASNLWAMDVDPKTMQPIHRPGRLTNWAGFSVGAMSASTDGRRLAITKRWDQSDVFVGELTDHNETLLRPRRFTTDERIDWPGDWSPDSKWLLLQSDRTGHMSIFRQRLDSAYPEPVVVNRGDNWSPVLSPDGKWLLYLASQPTVARLMRMPVAGGPAELILESKGPPAFVRSSKVPKTAAVRHVTTAGNPAFRCPARPGARCVLSEALGGEIVFSSFDPVPAAKKAEIFRIAVDDADAAFWDLSRDGTRIAYGSRGIYSWLHIRERKQQATHDIYIPDWPELDSVGWSADGKSLFATDYAPRGGSLLKITLDGKTRLLYKAAEPIELLKASPDGRYLAFGQVLSGVNAWLIEGIPH